MRTFRIPNLQYAEVNKVSGNVLGSCYQTANRTRNRELLSDHFSLPVAMNFRLEGCLEGIFPATVE